MHLVQHIRKGETTPMSIRRLAVLCTAMLCAGMLVLCRVFWIAADQSYAASAAAQTVSETVLPIRRGNFYDRIGRPLTGVTPRWYALCIPGDSSYATLFPFVPFAQQAQLYARRNSITPFLIEVEDDLSANGVFMVADARRYLPTPIARHLIGYLDGDGHGMTGLEKAYDDLLAAAGDAQAVLCTTTARGDLLAGTTPQVQTTARGTNTAITLTLDANIQRACEAIAAQNMSKGCIIVMQVGSGQILASTGMPEFDPDDIAASIRADDTSLINRSLSAFSAGSVFKVVLAAAAYAQGLDWFTYDCTGSIQTAGETFRCALGRAHGTVNLRGALEQSCNCYFIALGQLLGGLVSGATGAIGGTYGAMPEVYLKIFELAKSGKDLDKARELQQDACQIIYKMCSGKGNMYAMIKEILRQTGGPDIGGVRETLLGLQEGDKEIAKECVAMISAVMAKL